MRWVLIAHVTPVAWSGVAVSVANTASLAAVGRGAVVLQMKESRAKLAFDMTSAAPKESMESGVLRQAVLKVGDNWGLSQRELAGILQMSESTLSRMSRGQAPLKGPDFELGALLVRAYRSLDALLGGDDDKAQAWLQAGNDALGGAPLERMQSIAGLCHVVDYLDAMRGAP